MKNIGVSYVKYYMSFYKISAMSFVCLSVYFRCSRSQGSFMPASVFPGWGSLRNSC